MQENASDCYVENEVLLLIQTIAVHKWQANECQSAILNNLRNTLCGKSLQFITK